MRKFLVAVIGAVATAALIATALRCNMIYLPGTTVNGNDVSWKSKDTVWKEIYKSSNKSLTITFDDTTLTLPALEYKEPAVLTTNLKEYFTVAPITFDLYPEIRTEFIQLMYDANCRTATNAYIYTDEFLHWQLEPETYGYDIPIEEIVQSVYEGETVINLDNYKTKPEVTATELQNVYDSLVWMNDFKITYTDGTTLSGVDLVEMTDENTFIFELDNEYLDNFLKSIAKSYDSRQDVYEFKPTLSDTTITISRGKWSTFGKQLNTAKEREWLVEQINNHVSVSNRKPYMFGYDVIDNTYVEISIDAQHLWYYKDGELKDETDIVTGHLNKHDTPKGVYYMSECLRDKTLRGEGYTSFVSYWMRLTNSGIGLHDATWRNKFGNSIYTYNGSHGCINLPYTFAKELFKDSYVGMPVVIY